MPKKTRYSLRDLQQEARKFREPATEKEKAIVAAAVTLIGERGVDGATTAEIARRAGVTEKTLFRYFPSKNDLVRRVLLPLVMQRGLGQQWEQVGSLLKDEKGNLKEWYVAATTQELSAVSKNVGLTRTVSVELLQNADIRDAMGRLWHEHIWLPMIDGLEQLRANGVIRSTVDVEVLARAIHCLHVGYFLTRHVFAPHEKWDDAGEIAQMAEILSSGTSKIGRRAKAAAGARSPA